MTNRFNLLSAELLTLALAAPRPPTLVDVRSAEAFEAGHIPGSINVPVYDLGARRAELPANVATHVVVICDHRKRAMAGANFLTLIGFGGVSVLEGGIANYSGALATGPAPPRTPSGPMLRVVPNDDSD